MRKHILLFICLASCYGGHSQTTQADSLFSVGLTLFKKGKYVQSAETLLSAQPVALQNSGRNSVLYGDILHYLGTDYQGMGRSTEALPILLEALEIRREVLGPAHPECGKTLNNLALVCINLGKLEQAEGFALEALRLKEKDPGKETLEYSNSQNTLGQVWRSKGQYLSADSIVTDLMERRKRILKGEQNVPYANALNFKAGIQTLLFRFEEAEISFGQALEIMEKEVGKNTQQYLSVFINFGQLYAKMGQYEKAETAQRACLQMTANIFGKETHEYILALRNLGFVLQAQGRFQESLQVLNEALESAERNGGPESIETVQIMGNLAANYYYTGYFKESARFLKRELDVLEKSEIRDEEYYRVLLNYGIVLNNLKDFEASEQYLLKAEAAANYLQLPLQKLSALHHNFGTLYLDWGKLDQAEQRLTLAVSALKAKQAVLTADDISVFFKLVRLNQLKNNYEQALKYAQEGQGYLEKSVSASVIYLSESELRDVATFFFSRNNSIFEAAQYWNKPELNAVCYDNVLFVRGFVLENAVQLRREFEQEAKADDHDWLNWKALRRQLAAEYSSSHPDILKAESLERQANALEKKLAGEIAARELPLQLPHWQQVQQALSDDEAAVEMVRYETSGQQVFYVAMVLTKNASAPKAVPLFEEHELERLFGDDAYPLAKFYGIGADTQLYRLVFKPVEACLGNLHKVWYAPAGLLHRVNTQAMAVSPKQILADKIDMTLIGSTRQIIEKRALKVQHPGLPLNALLLGGINYKSLNSTTTVPSDSGSQRTRLLSTWPYLPATLNEVRGIERLLKTANIQVETASDNAATEQLVRQRCNGNRAPGILHIASHATFIPDTSSSNLISGAGTMNSGVPLWTQDPLFRVRIAMAGADDANNPGRTTADDGILTAYEISLLDLKGNQLAVVSACDSGLGDLDPNEGVWGLERAFRIAGAQNVILSLWKANDSSAKDFMDAFYYKWIVEKSSIHNAFTGAQNDLRKFNPDPRYWAGFILSE